MANNSIKNSERYIYSPEVTRYIGSDEVSRANHTDVEVLRREIKIDSDNLEGA